MVVSNMVTLWGYPDHDTALWTCTLQLGWEWFEQRVWIENRVDLSHFSSALPLTHPEDLG